MTLEELELEYQRDAKANPRYRALELAFIDAQNDLALAMDLLRDLEWSSWNVLVKSNCCPECEVAQYALVPNYIGAGEHMPDCSLAAMIGAKVKA
jgi:hypothetical protein